MTDLRTQPPVNTPKQSGTNGDAARGQAVAVRFMAHVKEQAVSLLRYLVDIHGMTQEGRKEFRVHINKALKEMREQVKELEGHAEHDVWKATLRSAGVRVSEAVTFSKAVDAGVPFHVKDNQIFDAEGRKLGYHFAVKMAGHFLHAEAATGPSVRRGRKAKPVADKLLHYVSETLRITAAEAIALLQAAQEQADAQAADQE